jgi:hypothetical protein
VLLCGHSLERQIVRTSIVVLGGDDVGFSFLNLELSIVLKYECFVVQRNWIKQEMLPEQAYFMKDRLHQYLHIH